MRIFTLAVCVLVGCSSPNYAYVPEKGEVKLTARSSVPRGSLFITNPAIVDFNVKKNDSQGVRSLRLRLTLRNREERESLLLPLGAQAVRFQLKEKNGRISSLAPIAPFYTTAARPRDQPWGALEVLPGEVTSVDLYFKLPAQARAAEALPRFEFDWRVGAGKSNLSGVANFNRVEVNDDIAQLRPTLRVYANSEDLPPIEPEHGFSVWTFNDVEPPREVDQFPATTTYLN
jgi:hypothetical protein